MKELDIIHILKTIHKMKAALAAVIENDNKLMKRSRHMYLNHTTIFSDSEEEKKLFLHNRFTEFINVDDREDTIFDGIKSDLKYKLYQLFVKKKNDDHSCAHERVRSFQKESMSSNSHHSHK